jgi:hypothetical protein
LALFWKEPGYFLQGLLAVGAMEGIVHGYELENKHLTSKQLNSIAKITQAY